MIDRVKKLLEVEQLSSSQFADEIKLQRSSLSHVLSGRNRPSLDFVMKIKQRFSEVNLEWLIFGTGHMFLNPESEKVISTPKPKSEKVTRSLQNEIEFTPKSEINFPSKQIENKNLDTNTDAIRVTPKSSDTKKVIVFYNDGTFEEYISR